MYDQIYWALTFGAIQHHNPVNLRPEMKNYTVFVDGMSKSLSATGVRVGWSMGPKLIIDKMKSILTHIGAWAPKAEQIASARYLSELDNYDAFMTLQKEKINARLQKFYAGFLSLTQLGYKVDAIAPQAAIYLAVQFNLIGQKTKDDKILSNTQDVTSFLLNEAKLALVPFKAFGAAEHSNWYRLSVGTCSLDEIDNIINNIQSALSKLSAI
jgi:aspartate aminotransferase